MNLVQHSLRWVFPIVLGSMSGLASTVIAMAPLTSALGDIAGGLLASLQGIGLGLLLAIFARLMVQLTFPPQLQVVPVQGEP